MVMNGAMESPTNGRKSIGFPVAIQLFHPSKWSEITLLKTGSLGSIL